MKRKTVMTLAIGAMLTLPALASAEDKYKSLDSNGDGMVSAAEHAAAGKAMFTATDANKDGYVTAAEMDAHWAKSGKSGADKAGMPSAAEKVKQLDTDGDGRVSAAEHDAGSQKMFTQMDTNGDGSISAAEKQAGHDAMKANKSH